MDLRPNLGKCAAMTEQDAPLRGKTIAVPESRQLDILAGLLERRGASVWRIPLVAIHDAPDPGPVLDWIKRFIATPPALFIILTGEGLRRLFALADRHGLRDELVQALATVTLLCRGPKPARALREVGIRTVLPALGPTTDGVIQTLRDMPIDGQRIAVQLYGEDPNHTLMSYLASRQARVDTVAPYVYADDSEESRVLELIAMLERGTVQAITFTSQPQFRRLHQVARKHQLEDSLQRGLATACVAAIGPVVARQLEDHGVRVDLMPGEAFFLKPLVTELMRWFASPTSDR